ncbi:hypothetical protein L1987_79299 [Smallanthus sonchifolius]|uniref:Uncharacterized protein n=1 Tax=Smallanthus sonchifolius TaxID=185202 RepID=A0ACB8ZES5_9ASTR|nr:hypothetical protein L1987_79299 [Smallanthus sonchifolius]
MNNQSQFVNVVYPPNQPPTAPPPSHHQPPPQQPQYAASVPAHYAAPPACNANWSSGLCACCSDVPNCCLTCWCPCITFGQIAEIVDKGNTWWQGNIERQNYGVQMPPMAPGGMYR